MRKLLIMGGLAAGAFVFAPTAPASAFLPGQTEILGAAAMMNDVIEIKRGKKARPPGWGRGRKVGWGGGKKPPGQRR